MNEKDVYLNQICDYITSFIYLPCDKAIHHKCIRQNEFFKAEYKIRKTIEEKVDFLYFKTSIL